MVGDFEVFDDVGRVDDIRVISEMKKMMGELEGVGKNLYALIPIVVPPHSIAGAADWEKAKI